jgi:predicted TIM-barrel fold metal-dependent hydrolase
VHVFDPARFPYTSRCVLQPRRRGESRRSAQLGHLLEAHGVGHALIVGPNSGYGLDNRCMLDALAHGNGRYKGIAVVRADASVSELTELKAHGVAGAAFNVTSLGIDYCRNLGPLLQRLRDLDLWADFQYEHDQLVELAPLLRDSGVKLVFDHCGRPHPERGVGQPGFQALLALAESGRACVKLSSLSKLSRQAHPYEDAWPFVHALIQAYTPAACVWASDWPFLRAPARIDYGPLVDLFESLVPDAQARQAIFWDTPRRLFGFGN